MDKSNELQNSMFNDTKNLSIEELNKNIAEIDKMGAIVQEIPKFAKKLAEEYWPGPLTMILRFLK